MGPQGWMGLMVALSGLGDPQSMMVCVASFDEVTSVHLSPPEVPLSQHHAAQAWCRSQNCEGKAMAHSQYDIVLRTEDAALLQVHANSAAESESKPEFGKHRLGPESQTMSCEYIHYNCSRKMTIIFPKTVKI